MGGQIMHTKKQETLVYTIGCIGFLAILVLNLKSGFSVDSLLVILKDVSPLMITVMLFYMLNGLFGTSDFKKSADKAITKIRQHYENEEIFDEDIFKTEKGKTECLFFAARKTQFIPLKELREGILEIHISRGTLETFGEEINETNKVAKIAKKKEEAKEKTIKILQEQGAKFKITNSKSEHSAIRIEFLEQQHISYERILEDVINDIIILLKERSM